MALNSKDIIRLLGEHGAKQYGREAVSQLEHALQCAHLAESAGESDEVVIASLLHDVGHMLMAENTGVIESDTERDDLHQYIAMPFLRGVFPDAVLEPIRLHVDAKRYLCAVEPSYWGSLSQASKNSLEQQGGPFTHGELDAFMSLPFAEEAIRLRRYDDLAKVPHKQTPTLSYFAKKLAEVSILPVE